MVLEPLKNKTQITKEFKDFFYLSTYLYIFFQNYDTIFIRIWYNICFFKKKKKRVNPNRSGFDPTRHGYDPTKPGQIILVDPLLTRPNLSVSIFDPSITAHSPLLVDATSGHELLRFVDAYSGYNQIKIKPKEREKTSFITS